MRVSIVAFGKIKAPGMRDSLDYYLGLIKPWVQIDEVELKPLSVPDKSPASRKLIQEKEAEILLTKLGSLLGKRGAFYILDETGKDSSTEEWAENIRKWEASALPHLAFCIGSSLGFSNAVREKARGALSLGKQTLPHELARVVLAEQLYRAWSVTRGHPYHNAG